MALAPPPSDSNRTLADRVAVSIVGWPRSCAEHLSSDLPHNDQDFLSATGTVKSVNDKFKIVGTDELIQILPPPPATTGSEELRAEWKDALFALGVPRFLPHVLPHYEIAGFSVRVKLFWSTRGGFEVAYVAAGVCSSCGGRVAVRREGR